MEQGYNFVDSMADADYIISIDANTTTGTKYDGIYFAYLDVNMSIINVAINEEVNKIHFDQIKGGGINYGKAGNKAYIIGAGKLKETLKNSVLVN